MKHIQATSCLLLILLLSACTEELLNETPSAPFEKGLEEVSLSLQCLPAQTVGDEWSASPDTRAADASIRDNLISNIWVFQYNSSGNQITAPHYYALPANTTASANVNVMLRPAANCTVYIIANMNSNSRFNGVDVSTLAKLEAVTHTFASESEVYGGANKNLLMSGSGSSLTIKAGQNNALGTISLKRMLAMITFKYKFATADLGTKLKVTRITLNSVPNMLKVGASTGTYPPTVDTPLEYSVITTPVAETYYTAYVPENLRGTISNTDEKNKNKDAPAGAVSIKLYIDSEVDGGSYVYTVYPGENNTNDFNIRRNYKYTLTLNLKSSVTDSRVMAAPANCFVMKQGASIIFDPYERTETGGGWKYTDYVDKTVVSKKFTRVDILWQTGDGSKFAIGNNSGTTKKVYLQDDKVYVTAGNTDGNAVIAGYNSSGVILWSWHIWVNDSSPAQVANAVKYTTYSWDSSTIYTGTRVPGFSFMACNLGATSTSKGDMNTFGLYYQWGRKDPFPQTARAEAATTFYPNAYPNVTPVYDNATKILPMPNTAGGASDLFQTKKIDQLGIEQTGAASINYAIQHPTVFMATVTPALFENGGEASGQPGPGNGSTHDPAYYVNDGDWYWGHNDKLWGGVPFNDATIIYKDAANTPIVANNGASKKSLFDPCPSGWILPQSDAWMGFTSTGLNTGSVGSEAIHNATQNYSNYGAEYVDLGLSFFMQAWRSGPTSHFPLCGWRTGDGSCFVVKLCGGYYTSAASFNNASSILHIHPSLVNPYDYGYQYARRSCAYPIRCVREVK